MVVVVGRCRSGSGQPHTQSLPQLAAFSELDLSPRFIFILVPSSLRVFGFISGLHSDDRLRVIAVGE